MTSAPATAGPAGTEPKPAAATMAAGDMQGAWAEGIAVEAGDVTGTASRLMLMAMGAFVAWSCLFPLGSAVVAEGTLIARGQNKVLQHRTGGVIAGIFAREGDIVEAGQVIYRLDPVVDQAELTRLRGRYAVLSAIGQRLEAEKRFAAGGDSPAPQGFSLRGLRAAGQDDALLHTGSTGAIPLAASDPQARPGPEALLLLEQQREFEKGRGALLAEIDGLTNRMDALKRRKAGLGERIAASQSQLGLLVRQVEAMRPLAQRGHIARKAVWDIEEQMFARKGELANLRAEEGALANEIAEVGARIQQARLADQRQASGRATEVIAEMAQIADQIKAAMAAVASTEVRAPLAGTVIHAKHTTIGGVVPGGEVMAQIVPRGAELAFRARVAPNDITHVKVGSPVRAKITALNARTYDDIEGTVSLVAADASMDDKTGQRFFEVEIRLLGSPKDKAGQPVLSAGMLGQAFIQGESRTFAAYLLSPLTDSLRRSFREP